MLHGGSARVSGKNVGLVSTSVVRAISSRPGTVSKCQATNQPFVGILANCHYPLNIPRQGYTHLIGRPGSGPTRCTGSDRQHVALICDTCRGVLQCWCCWLRHCCRPRSRSIVRRFLISTVCSATAAK